MSTLACTKLTIIAMHHLKLVIQILQFYFCFGYLDLLFTLIQVSIAILQETKNLKAIWPAVQFLPL